ncbi:hypothetical protein LIER_26967 [Lithospermum erythrorhizon]|uniref:K-box domain-containing protein n=1 Tax=Lithospermum erythrorhizon TaxID=34254 RepID=A0AAV3RDB6_LITER
MSLYISLKLDIAVLLVDRCNSWPISSLSCPGPEQKSVYPFFISLDDAMISYLRLFSLYQNAKNVQISTGTHIRTSSIRSLAEIVQRYHNVVEAEANESGEICKMGLDNSKIGAFLTINDLLDGVERHLEDPDQFSSTDFIHLEDQLAAALLETRARKTHLMLAAVTELEEKEKLLTEENRLLQEKIAMEVEKIDEGNADSDTLPNQTPQTLKFF